MNRRLIPLFIFLVAMVGTHDAVADGLYFVPSVIHTDADDDRLVESRISGGEIIVGEFLSDRFALEGRLGMHGFDNGDDLDLTEFGLAGLWAFRHDRYISPYLTLGAGLINSDSALFGDELAPFYSYGAGFNIRFNEDPVALRLEYRVRNSFEHSIDPRDNLFSLGVVIPFGKKDTPMPAPVAAPDPDSDGDGVPDSRDRCADTPANHTVDQNGCSLDSDGDGVADADDQCPDTYRGATVDAAGCELDDDNDGVVNRLDKCPNTPAGVRVDVNGCEIKDIIELPGVNFETNSDRLLPGADGILRDAAATLQKYPDMIVEVAGHTDSAGAADYNQGLSERRAETVRDYLINAGAAADNLTARGYGEANPVADNATAEGRALNRRVELRIVEQ